MENVRSIISRHNKKTLRATSSKTDKSETMCNCRDKKACPLDGKCLQHNVVYKASVTANSET